MTTTLTAIGLVLAAIGAITLVAWRYGRSRARVPAVLLGVAILVLATPPLLERAVDVIDRAPPDAAGPEHPDDAVVHPDDLQRGE